MLVVDRLIVITMNTLPSFIHFYSPHTRISLELPLGFEEQQEDEERRSVIYADDLDDDDPVGARVLAHAFPVEGGSLESLAEASATIPGRLVESRQQCTIEAYPAMRQLLSYRDTDLALDVLRHETWVQVDAMVFSVIFVTPAPQVDRYRPAWEHATETLRLILPETNEVARNEEGRLFTLSGRSWAHHGMGFSLAVPQGWEITQPEEQLVRLFGPEHPEHDDYRPTFSIAAGTPGGFGDEWFDQFCAQSRQRLQDSSEEFSLDRTERITLSSLVEAEAIWYRWRPSPVFRSVQLQAPIPVGRYRMFLINAATVEPLAGQYQPLFDEILRSLRVL